jgi:hypothetical protein
VNGIWFSSLLLFPYDGRAVSGNSRHAAATRPENGARGGTPPGNMLTSRVNSIFRAAMVIAMLILTQTACRQKG